MGMERVRKSSAAVGIIGCYQGGSVIESWLPEGICEAKGIALRGEDKFADPCRMEWWNSGGALYRFALSQVIPFSVSGVVWYQGESNGREAEAALYEAQLRTLIERWRSDFSDEKLPFVIVQIHDFWRPASKKGWNMVQQAQAKVASDTDNVYLAVSRDVCEEKLIHPTQKEELALRIARAWDK
jgi:sialate O-acetylesterase